MPNLADLPAEPTNLSAKPRIPGLIIAVYIIPLILDADWSAAFLELARLC